MSMCILIEFGENASVRPVMRSSKRAPTQTIRSQSCIGHVGFVGAVHAQHAEPVFAGCRIGAKAHQGRGDRETGQGGQFTQQLAGLGAGIDDAGRLYIESASSQLPSALDGLADVVCRPFHLRAVALVGR